MADVAVFIPLMRPNKIAPLVQNIAECTDVPHNIVVIATGECADAARDLNVTLIEDEGGTYPVRINRAFRETNEPHFLCAADDLWFRPGWYQAVMRVMEGIHGVVAVNDLMNSAGVHFFVERAFVNTLGGCIGEPGIVFHEGYLHSYCDDEFRATAKFHGRWGYAQEAVIEHCHPGVGKSQSDETYRVGEASMTQGRELLHSRSHLWGQ